MRAIQYARYGGPEVLEVVDTAAPAPGSGQVRVRVRAASVNPVDWKIRAGMLGDDPAKLPGTPGFDGAGVVDAVGEGVDETEVGAEVLGLGSATYAELAVLRVWVPKPPSVAWEVAGALGTAAETAVRVLTLLGVGAGHTVLIDGGSGGVGSLATQVAVARGARVLATGGQGNQDYLAGLGATPVRYGSGMADRVRELAGDRVDAVFDAVGKTPMPELLGLVAEPAQVVTIANYGAAEFGARLTTGGEGDPRAGLAEVAGLAAAGRLQLPVQTFPLEQAGAAQRLSQEGHVRGKLVLVP